MKKRIAISIGDLNGIGLELALKAHDEVKGLCEPIYCIGETMLQWGAALLGRDVPMDFKNVGSDSDESFEIAPGVVSEKAGKASFDSFCTAVALARSGNADAITTLPINKEAWSIAGIVYAGHTDALEDMLDESAVMMLGCEQLWVMLYTHHIPLGEVADRVKSKALTRFLLKCAMGVEATKIGVLGLNPHAGDGGVLGSQESKIAKAIHRANEELGKSLFFGPLVPDYAFTPKSREECSHFVCMYHDQGLIPLKALYFDESVNVSVGLPIVRTSPDHGTAFDIAYKGANPSTKSYINAIKMAIKMVDEKPVLDF
jgi:4-hydroxythreonine-4-phosphate dehydrogenase